MKVVFLSLVTTIVLFAFLFKPSGPSINTVNFAGHEFAHRGGYQYGPENTLATIQESIKRGAKAIEVDVQISKDGQLVLFHDEMLDKVSDGKGRVSDYTLAELKKFRVKDINGNLTEERIASLKEVLEATPSYVFIELDCKRFVPDLALFAQKLAELYKDQSYLKRMFISALHPLLIYFVRQQNPEIVTAFTTVPTSGQGEIVDSILTSSWLPLFLGVGIIEPNRARVNQGFIEYWTRKDRVLNVWTLNTEKDKAKFLGTKVSFTSNCPGDFCADQKDDEAWGALASK